MVVRPGRFAAASALALGAVAVVGGPAAADTVHRRTDTFQQCQVQSRLVLLDSGDIEVGTAWTEPIRTARSGPSCGCG